MVRPLRLLLIEHDDAGREAVRLAVASSEEPVTLVEARDEAAAERQLESADFDCVLIDANLPGADPLRLLERASRAAAILLTGQLDRSAAERAIQRGAQDCLVRSTIHAGMLLRSIRYAIERKRATELRLQLQHSDRLASLGQLAASVAHEINNPVTYVASNLEFLHQDLAQICGLIADLEAFAAEETRPERKAALQQLLRRHEADRLSRDLPTLRDENAAGLDRIVTIVKKLRSFSRVGPAKTELIDTGELLSSACQMAEHEIRHRARLRLDVSSAPPIFADRGELHQVFTNLLLNAAQAIPDDDERAHEIRVSATSVNGYAVLAVADTGAGIPPHILPRIFEPFFTTKQEQGTGLGLAISAEIVKKHGGTIEVESRVGQGTTFTVRFPEARAETRLQAPALPRTLVAEGHEPALGPRPQRLRLLVIDDEAMILKTYRRLLKDHDLTLVDSGRDGLAEIERDPEFDGILCDLMMPDLDGCSFHRQVAEVAPELLSRIVFCTGGAFTPRALEFVSSLTTPVLEKPIGWPALSQVVARWQRERAERPSLPPVPIDPTQLKAISNPGLDVRKS